MSSTSLCVRADRGATTIANVMLRLLVLCGLVAGVLGVACAPSQSGHRKDAAIVPDATDDGGEAFDPVTGDPAGRLVLGTTHSCWLRETGEVLCWGSNADGELGDGTADGRAKAKPVIDIEGIVRLTARSAQTCAIDSDEALWCWGKNNWGQLGAATAANFRTTPVMVESVGEVSRASAGVLHTCAVRTDGSAWCWGANSDGALGRGTAATSAEPPAAVNDLSGVSEVSAGQTFGCAVRESAGTVACWGRNTNAQLGDGSAMTRLAPVDVTGLPSKAKSVATGVAHACALLESGDVYCWGANDFGQVGSGAASGTDVMSAAKVSGINADVVAIAAGGQTTCALRSGGVLACWGLNNFKQIVDSPDGFRAAATDVVGVSNVEFMGVGTGHVCAASGDSVYCWGSNTQGQVGVDSDGLVVAAPMEVPLPGDTE